MRVAVYFNLHRKVWSIMALEGERKNRVIGHARTVQLCQSSAKISRAGQRWVRTHKRKTVHAYIVGHLAGVSSESLLAEQYPLKGPLDLGGERITYNPYVNDTFVSVADGATFIKATVATLHDKRVYVWGATFEQQEIAA